MQFNIHKLSTPQKVFGLALIGVVIYAVYVRSKNASQSPAVATTQPTGGGTGLVTPSQDLSGLTSSIASAFKTLGTQNQQIATSLAGVLKDSNAKTVDAINAQSSTFATALNTLGQGNLKAIADLQKAEADTKNAVGSLGTQLQDFLTPQFKGFTDALATQLALINKLSAASDKLSDQEYLAIGLKSSSACYRGGSYATDCVRANLPDYVHGNWKGGNLSDADIQQFVKANNSQDYASCLQGDHYDPVCVGKKIAGV